MHATITERANAARHSWVAGRQLEGLGFFDEAYLKYTTAHDLVIDCPRMHWQAHRHLARINWKRRNIGELIEDRLLLCFAPLGVFVLIAWLLKRNVLKESFCTGRPAA